MKTGRVWAGTIDDIPVQVVYTRHFSDRFEHDEGDRPAVARYVDEPEILDVIVDALPGITDKWRSIWDHSGIITSRGRDLNMSFVTETDNDGMTVVMKNMMLKHAYQPHSEDYVFAVAGLEMGDQSSQMDPEEAVKYAIAAFEKGDIDGALLALEDLSTWLKGGSSLKPEAQAKLMKGFIDFLTSSNA